MSWVKRHARNARRKAARARREGTAHWSEISYPVILEHTQDIEVDGVLYSFQGVPY